MTDDATATPNDPAAALTGTEVPAEQRDDTGPQAETARDDVLTGDTPGGGVQTGEEPQVDDAALKAGWNPDDGVPPYVHAPEPDDAEAAPPADAEPAEGTPA